MNYPEQAGWKEPTTSKLAAKKTNACALRAAVARALCVRDMTADECAMELERSILAVRPRFSELRALNMIAPTGERRRNDRGHSQIVWRLTI